MDARDLLRAGPRHRRARLPHRRVRGRADRPAVHDHARPLRAAPRCCGWACGTAGTPTATPRPTSCTGSSSCRSTSTARCPKLNPLIRSAAPAILADQFGLRGRHARARPPGRGVRRRRRRRPGRLRGRGARSGSPSRAAPARTRWASRAAPSRSRVRHLAAPRGRGPDAGTSATTARSATDEPTGPRRGRQLPSSTPRPGRRRCSAAPASTRCSPRCGTAPTGPASATASSSPT